MITLLLIDKKNLALKNMGFHDGHKYKMNNFMSCLVYTVA